VYLIVLLLVKTAGEVRDELDFLQNKLDCCLVIDGESLQVPLYGLIFPIVLSPCDRFASICSKMSSLKSPQSFRLWLRVDVLQLKRLMLRDSSVAIPKNAYVALAMEGMTLV